MGSFKFIHTADIHLDSPLRGLSRYEGAPEARLRGATRRAFEALVQRAIDEPVAFVVIAGDLYDGDWRDFNTGLFFVRQLGRLREAGIRVYLVHGNHDAESQLTRSLPLPDNVVRFASARAETFQDRATGAALHGRSFREARVVENLAVGYPARVAGAFNIGVLHTALEGHADHASYAPCSTSELRTLGYDYWALGHVHEAKVVARDPWIVFPGNLQGRNARETGPRGAMLISVDEGAVASAELLPFDVVRWLHLRVDASGAAAVTAVEQRCLRALEEALESEGPGRLLAIRMTLHGATAAHGALLAGEVTLEAHLRALAGGLAGDAIWIEKIRCETAPPPAPSLLASGELTSDLLRLLDEAALDDELRAKLQAELASLFGRLPRDERLPESDGPLAQLRDGDIDGVLREAMPLLRERISAANAGPEER